MTTQRIVKAKFALDQVIAGVMTQKDFVENEALVENLAIEYLEDHEVLGLVVNRADICAYIEELSTVIHALHHFLDDETAIERLRFLKLVRARLVYYLLHLALPHLEEPTLIMARLAATEDEVLTHAYCDGFEVPAELEVPEPCTDGVEPYSGIFCEIGDPSEMTMSADCIDDFCCGFTQFESVAMDMKIAKGYCDN
jgi:hypothetical protein